MKNVIIPSDQNIVDEYFRLRYFPGLKSVAWLFGMVATYGTTPQDLIGFDWGPENQIKVQTKKRMLRPLHPQWVSLFQLLVKTPDIEKVNTQWEKAINKGQALMDAPSLITAYKMRKVFYKPVKQPLPAACPVPS